MKKETARKSIWASGISLLICVLLLLGTTFAWFTDSVTNKNNRIQSGNLKVELQYKSLTDSENNWKTVDEKTPLFTEDVIWEPNMTQGYQFRVVNNGSLVIDWQMLFSNIVSTVGANGADIADVLTVYLSTGGNDWAEIATMAQLRDGKRADDSEQAFVHTGYKLEAGQTSPAFAVKITMDQQAGNDYQGASITFDTVLNAKQASVEKDGFGNQEYDKDAVYPVLSADKLDQALANAKPGDVIIAKDVTYDKPFTINTDNITIAGEGNTLFTDMVVVKSNGVTFDGVSFEKAWDHVTQDAPIKTENRDLILRNCKVTRIGEEAQPYGCLVDVGEGKLTAVNTVFTAPYDASKAQAQSPSTINALGGVNLDGCTIATDGYAIFSQHVTTGIIRNTVFKGIEERPTLGVNSTLFDGMVFDGCTFEMGINSNVTAGNFTIRNSTFDFTKTPENGAGNAIGIYAENGPIVLENNTFNFTKDSQRGINLTWADFAKGDYNAANVTISGNTFNGTGATAIRVTNKWENHLTAEEYAAQNTFGNSKVEIEP